MSVGRRAARLGLQRRSTDRTRAGTLRSVVARRQQDAFGAAGLIGYLTEPRTAAVAGGFASDSHWLSARISGVDEACVMAPPTTHAGRGTSRPY